MKLISSLIAFVLILTVVAVVPLRAAGDAAAGKDIFAKKCASCHGVSGEAKESIAKMMKVEMRHLGSKEVLAKSDADLAKASKDGVGKMKAVAGLTDKQAGDVVAFMRTLKK